MNEQAWLALHRIPGIGSRTQRTLLDRFGDASAIFQAGAPALRDLGLRPAQVSALQKDPADLLIAADRHWLQGTDNQLCRWTDHDYPALLRHIPDPPMLLYLRGQRGLLDQAMLAIVGSRSPSPGGAITAEAFAKTLAGTGLVIVSGLAAGIDAAAHRGALSSGTIGVMGTGPDRIYPRSNLGLAREMAKHGLLISEQPPGTGSRAGLFPRRNRIISGLCLGVLVVEAGEASGSLITARLAAEQGREVFAIPGSIHSPLSRGPHRLIREGAKLVESAMDVLEELGPLPGVAPGIAPLDGAPWQPEDPREQAVWEAMDYAPSAPEQIAARAGLTLAELSAILLAMELQGRIAASPGGFFCRLPSAP
ncbi:DNA-processing protein DprA [Acidithiobacillus sulfuriphilus]|uniref:DNA-processing protein DprA n=1 Tax=Acidithiobacillus sulfuriphilus TaxID=1867749 RepID=UPI003F6255FB